MKTILTASTRLALTSVLLIGGIHALSAGAAADDLASTSARTEAVDNDIAKRVSEMLTRRDDISISDLDVDVDFGVVTLHGYVTTSAAKHLAERHVGDVRGVQGVVNAIIVSPGIRP